MPTERCMYASCRYPAVVVPVVRVPITNWPHPAFLMLRGGICEFHQMAFSLSHFTDYYTSWYDMIRADVESYRKLVRDPVTGIVSMVDGGYRPAELSECQVEFKPLGWSPKSKRLWR